MRLTGQEWKPEEAGALARVTAWSASD